MLEEAKKEIARSDEIWKSTGVTALREQQEKDFGLWGPYEFHMPKGEGKWDEVTTNSSKILANKIMGLLSSSWLQLYIDVTDEVRGKRKKISQTEQLANGCIWVADREAISVPSGKKVQSSLSTYAVIRGGTAKSVYWYSDDKDKPICDIRVYDPTYCQWIEGEKEFLWFCYRGYVTKEFIERTYEEKMEEGFNIGDADKYKRIRLYTFWDEEKWKVAINGEYIDETRHGLGYIPVNVRSCGSAPYIQSEEYQDTMKWSWVSCFANNRDIYDLESKLLSIEASKAIESGKIKIAGEYDSSQGSGELPHGIEKLGYSGGTRNEIIMFDTNKGQKFGGMVQPPGNEVIDQFLTRVRGMDIIGSIDPIAFGQMTRSGSGVLAAELRAAALEFINPFRECVENDFIWIAEECVKQFKNGEYAKVSVEGRDRKREKFYIDLERGDVEEKRFDCELVADRLRDKLQELGAAIQEVTYGLNSRKGAMVEHNIVADPDRTLDEIDEEKHKELAATDPVMHNKELANYYKDQGDDEMALYHLKLAEIAIEATIAGMMGVTTPGGEKKPSTVSPQMNAMKTVTEPQQIV